ncbi:MAG: hypothetical protein QM628_00410 [Propionicimonas sp.]
MTTITTAAELDALPLGTVFTDRDDDIWMISYFAGTPDVRLTSPETAELPVRAVLKKWGPLTLQWRPDQPPATDEPATVKPSVEEVKGVVWEHAAARSGDGRVECSCGAILWTVQTGSVEAGVVRMYGGQPVAEAVHSHHVARAVLALLPGRTEAEVKAEALREYAAARYVAYLEQPEVPWVDQPSDLAKKYANAAEELRDEADRIEREG